MRSIKAPEKMGGGGGGGRDSRRERKNRGETEGR